MRQNHMTKYQNNKTIHFELLKFMQTQTIGNSFNSEQK